MKVGVFAPAGNPFATPEYLKLLGEATEERGFDSLWMAEHVVLFDEYSSQYPYSADGKIPAGGENGGLGGGWGGEVLPGYRGRPPPPRGRGPSQNPTHPPPPPIWFGGESDAALRRVADIGNGWYPFNIDPDELPARFATLDTFLDE